MASKQKDNQYDDAFLTDVPAGEEEFSLEEILAEYGGSRSQKLMEDVERTVEPPPAEEKTPAEKTPEEPDPAEQTRARARDKLLAQAVDLEKLERELPRPPQPVSLEEVVGSTVEAVMEEREPLLKPRRSLFSRRKLEDTEQLPTPPEPEEVVAEPIGPEMELSEAAAALRELSLPCMGILTKKSQFSWARRVIPSPSLPMTMAAAPRRSAS